MDTRCCWSTCSIIHYILEYLCVQFASGSGHECHWGQSVVQNKRQMGPRLKMLWKWDNIKTFMGLILPLSPHRIPTKKKGHKTLNQP